MKKISVLVVSTFLLVNFLLAVSAHAYEREFFPDEGFRAGCEHGGFQGVFQFLRNGRIGTLKFPDTQAAFVLFQVNENDPYRWSVTNESDRLDMDFESGRLSYRYQGGDVSYACEGSFQPKIN